MTSIELNLTSLGTAIIIMPQKRRFLDLLDSEFFRNNGIAKCGFYPLKIHLPAAPRVFRSTQFI